jgi:arylsulfatase A-like enzyme
MKCHLHDSGTGVMLIVKGPGGFNGGNVVDGAVSHMDLFPTICELAGIERPAWLQGKSIMPLVRGEAQEIHDELFFEINYHAAYEPMRAVRTKRWKYIRQLDGRGRTVLPTKDNGPSKEVWVRAGWRERPVPAEELYDLVFDPNETCNLAAQPEHRDTLAGLRARLLAWMEETNDPMLRGPAPAPADAVADDPNLHSPGEGTRPILELHGPTHIAPAR